MPAGMAETATAAPAGGEVVDNGEFRPHHRHDHQLGDVFADLDGEGFGAPVPAGNKQLALIIAVDQAHQIAQDDAVLVAQSRTGRTTAANPGSAIWMARPVGIK